MRCPDEPQLEEGEGHEQDGDSGDMAPALNQQLGLRGLTRGELCRHLRHSPGKLEELDGVRPGRDLNSSHESLATTHIFLGARACTFVP
jgi:hypothetical protein